MKDSTGRRATAPFNPNGYAGAVTLAGLVSLLLSGIVALAPFSTGRESEFRQHGPTALASWSPDVIVEDDIIPAPVDETIPAPAPDPAISGGELIFRRVVLHLAEERNPSTWLSDANVSRFLRRSRLAPVGIARRLSTVEANTPGTTPDEFLEQAGGLLFEIDGLVIRAVSLDAPLEDANEIAIGVDLPEVIRDPTKDYVEFLADGKTLDGRFKQAESGLYWNWVTQVPPAFPLLQVTKTQDVDPILGVLDQGWVDVTKVEDTALARFSFNAVFLLESNPLFVSGKRLVEPTLWIGGPKLEFPPNSGDLRQLFRPEPHGAWVTSIAGADGVGRPPTGEFPPPDPGPVSDPSKLTNSFGRDLQIRPMMIVRGARGPEGKSLHQLATALELLNEEIATRKSAEPEYPTNVVRVLNLSQGSEVNIFDLSKIAADERALFAKANKGKEQILAELRKQLKTLTETHDVVVVAAAGNQRQYLWDETSEADGKREARNKRPPRGFTVSYYPAAFGPANADKRFALSEKWTRLFVVVGGSNKPKANEGFRERLWDGRTQATPKRFAQGSNFGHHVSLIAPAEHLRLASPLHGTAKTLSGTSYATPQVAAAIAQVLRILQKVPTGTLTPAHAEVLAERAVQIVEETADPLEPETMANPDGSAEIPVDRGHGRLNCWKAVLAAANGGLSEQPAVFITEERRTVPETLTGSQVPVKGDLETTYYGFDIRSPVAVRVQLRPINGNAVALAYRPNALLPESTDFPSPGNLEHRVATYLGTTLPLVVGEGGNPAVRPFLPVGKNTLGAKVQYSVQFTLLRSEINNLASGGWLELVNKAETVIMKMRLDLSNLRRNNAAKGDVTLRLDPDPNKLTKEPVRRHVRFDDFVFYISAAPIPGN